MNSPQSIQEQIKEAIRLAELNDMRKAIEAKEALLALLAKR